MRPFVLASFILSIGFATLSFYFWSESAKKDVVVSELETEVSRLESDLAAVPQPSAGNHFIEISDRVREVDCPRYEPQGPNQSVSSEHCAFALSLYQNPEFQMWFGVIEITGSYINFQREDIWAMEAGSPAGTMKDCHAIEVTNANPNFEGKLFELGELVTLPPTLVPLPYDILSQEERALLKDLMPSDQVRVLGMRDSYIASVHGDVCGKGFDQIISIEKI